MTIKKLEYTDDMPMPYGEHKGVRLGDVPVAYMLWLFRQPWIVGPEHINIYTYLLKMRNELMEEEQNKDSGASEGFDSYADYERYGR